MLDATFQGLVAVELGSVVKRDGLEAVLVFPNGGKSGLRGRRSGSGVELLDDGEAGFSFHKSQEAVVGIAAHHGISFPMAEEESAFDLGGTLGDVALTRQNSARIFGSVAFSVGLGHDPQVANQCSPVGLVIKDVSVDGFVADGE